MAAAFDLEVIHITQVTAIRSFCEAKGIAYETAVGVRSSGTGTALYFEFTNAADRHAVRAAFGLRQ